MDTIETNEPVGAEGATSSQDTSSNDTQPVETTNSTSDGNAVEAGEAPQLLAGKYKSPEELEKAYQELQSKLGETSQKAELANLLEKNTGMNYQQIKEALARQEQERMEQAIQENPGLAAFQKVQQLESQIALQAEEKELDSFLNSEEGRDYAPFKDKIFKLGLNLEKDKSYAEIAKEYFGNARAQGQQDAYKKIDTKIMTRTTGASQAPPRTRLTPEDMEKMSVAELEAILPHADITNRPYN